MKFEAAIPALVAIALALIAIFVILLSGCVFERQQGTGAQGDTQQAAQAPDSGVQQADIPQGVPSANGGVQPAPAYGDGNIQVAPGNSGGSPPAIPEANGSQGDFGNGRYGNGSGRGSQNGSRGMMEGFDNMTNEERQQALAARLKASSDACSGLSEGDACTLQSARGSLNGTCFSTNGTLYCTEAGMRQGGMQGQAPTQGQPGAQWRPPQ